MTNLSTLSPAALKAAMQGGTEHWGSWASASEHVRYMEPVPPRMRRRCHCGCKKRATYSGKCNGIALYTACEMSVARWVKTGHP